jgi:biopolymer transport protein TolR
MGGSIKQSGRPSGGRRGRARKHAPMAEINVTPFVDVMLVLLIIFMVTAPLLTAGVPLDLPQAKGKAIDAQNKEPIVLSITKDGQIFLGQEDKVAVTLDEIGPKLQAITKNTGDTDPPIFVRGDKNAVYGVATQVMARIQAAGFKKLSLVLEGEGG